MMKTKRLVLAALCVALGVVLPMALHPIVNAGSVLLPMHIPVLLCGLICGWQYGLACGILAPLLSSVISGMPPVAYLPSMICELSVYGLMCGLMMRHVRTGRLLGDIYISLITSMLIGRIIYGATNALIFNAGEYSMNIWISAAFITSLPGIAIQLVLIPLIVMALEKTGMIGRRYRRSAVCK
ncbi:MAG: ECF transporter S component [Clostridia bacterium]